MFLYAPFDYDSRVLKEARTLSSAGYEVRIIAMRGDAVPPDESIANVRVVRVEAKSRLAELMRRLRLARVGRAIFRIEAVLSWRRFLRNALREAAASPADVWYAHNLDTLPAGARARRRHGGALIYDSHELYLDRPLDRPRPRIVRAWWRRTEARLIHDADRVFVDIPSRGAILASRYGIEQPTVIMNTPPYSPTPTMRSGVIRECIGLGNESLVVYLGIVQGGRLPGLRMLVRSMPHLSPHTHLVLVGPGDADSRAELHELADQLGVGDRVHLLPAIHPDEIREQLADADVGVVPFLNRDAGNTLPTKLFDYLAAGVPIATSDFPEMSELIERYEVGATFDPEQPSEIAAAIEEIIADPERRARLRANAVSAAKEFKWEDQGTRLLAAVNELSRRPVSHQ
jgi:glycosyltransferase involved in cell wall biosynthesis